MARDLDRQYQSYSRTHERTGPILLTILAPLAATIAGLAITGTTGAPVVALALTGGATFAYGSTLASTVRERIYAEGKTATSCLVGAYSPLLLPEAIYASFRAVLDEQSLLKDRNALIMEIQRVRGLPDLPKNAPEILDTTDALAKNIAELHQKGLDADRLFRSVGRLLPNHLRTLAAEINRALEKTELDSAALKSKLISALSSASLDLTGAKTVASKDASLRSQLAAIASRPGLQLVPDPLAKLQDLVVQAETNAAPVRNVLDRLGDNLVQQAKDCVDKAIAGIQIKPLELSGQLAPTLAPEAQATVTITGGVRPYKVTALGDAGMALDLTLFEPEPGLAVLTIAAKRDAKPGSYVIEVTDNPRSSTRAIPVSVQPLPGILLKTDQKSSKQGETFLLLVTGGTPPYKIETIDGPSLFSSQKEEAKGGAQTAISAVVKDNAVPSEYQIQVRDSKDRPSNTLKIKIEKK